MLRYHILLYTLSARPFLIKLQVVGWPGKDNKTCWPVRRKEKYQTEKPGEKMKRLRKEDAKERRKSRKKETWRELASVVRSNPVSMSLVLERKPNYMALPLARWRSVCMCVCVCAFRRLVSLGWLTAPIFPPHSPPIWEHIHTDTKTRSRGNFSDSISLFEAPITIAAITVKGTPPPANRKSRTRPYTLKKRAVIWTTQEVELALY